MKYCCNPSDNAALPRRSSNTSELRQCRPRLAGGRPFRGAQKPHAFLKWVSFRFGNQKRLTFTFLPAEELMAWTLHSSGPLTRGDATRSQASRFVRLDPRGAQ